MDISTWVKINGAAPIEHHVYGGGEVELEIGGHGGLGLHLTTEGLETLVRVASDALMRELEIWVERHYAQQLAPADLGDPALYIRSKTAFAELAGLLKLPLMP